MESIIKFDLRPVGRIDFLGTDGQVGESCYYYTEDDFLKTVEEQNYCGVPMSVNVFRNKDGNTIPLDFVKDFDPLPQGFEVLDYKEGEDFGCFGRLYFLAPQIKSAYPKGTRLELGEAVMAFEPFVSLCKGTQVTVNEVSNTGIIHATTDEGTKVELAPEYQLFHIVTERDSRGDLDDDNEIDID